MSSPPYRYDYQGIEKDAETGQNAFELRNYDARLGRWFNPDPYGQFASPYLAMGNAHTVMVDPTGGFAWDKKRGQTSYVSYSDDGDMSGGTLDAEWVGSIDHLYDFELGGKFESFEGWKGKTGGNLMDFLQRKYDQLSGGRNGTLYGYKNYDNRGNLAGYSGLKFEEAPKPDFWLMQSLRSNINDDLMDLATIDLSRTWETNNSTISTFSTSDGSVSGYIMEPPGPSTKQANQNKRIPEGIYDLMPHNGTDFQNVFKLYNDDVPTARGILIHIGNYPRDTHGCLLPGTTRGTDFIGGSGKSLLQINEYIKEHINNGGIKIIINDPHKL